MLTFATFQTLVRRWVVRAFGAEVSDDRTERVHRFLEEALELAQSTGCTQEQAHVLVEYVYARPVGQPQQEVGGTLVTLAALCAAHQFDMNTCAAAELMRVNRPAALEKIRAKQAAKRHDIPLSPLPLKPLDVHYFVVDSTNPGKCLKCGQSHDAAADLGDRTMMPAETKCIVTGDKLGDVLESSLRPRTAPLFCPTCNRTRNTYLAGEGDSAPAGSLCCTHCSHVLLSPKPAFSPPGQGAPQPERQYTDAVGTDGGKATVSRRI